MEKQRFTEISFDAMDYVEEYEGTALHELNKNITPQNYKSLVDKVESGMYAKGIITSADYEICKVNEAVSSGVWIVLFDMTDC
jgi:hypothetical protein